MNVAIILSGGIGSRMATNVPKQYLMVNGKPIIAYCVETFAKREDIGALVVVIADEWKDFFMKYVTHVAKPFWFVSPGETRQHSIYNGLKICRENGVEDNAVVIIHDAARPLVSDTIIDECINGCRTHDGVLPVIRVKDTIYMSEDGTEIGSLLNRNHLFAGQAPESFLFGKYIKLHDESTYDEIAAITGSTEIAYRAGLHIKLAKGDEMNFKITTPEDLNAFETIVNQRNNNAKK